MADQVTALVLDPQAVFANVPVHFPGLPGVWTPGEPIAASELLERLTDVDDEDALRARVEELGHPLRFVDVDAGTAPMPRAATQIASEEEVRTGREPMPDVPMPDGELLPTGSTAAELADDQADPEASGPAAMTVTELDDTYGHLDGYPTDAKRARKVSFVGKYLAAQADAEAAAAAETAGNTPAGEAA